MKKTWKKELGLNSILLCSSLLVACLAGELTLRVLGYYGVRESQVMNLRVVQDNILDYRLQPNSSWIYNNLRYTINAHGWRDYDYAYEKAQGVFRIVVLGDSVTHGYGVSLEASFAKQLERFLNEGTQTPARYEVILIALEGINTEQEAHLLEIEGLKYDPDMVVLGYVLNDPANGNSLRVERQKAERKDWADELKRIAVRSSLVHYTYKGLKKLSWQYAIWRGTQDTEQIVRDDEFTFFHQDPGTWGRVERAFAKIARVTQPRGIDVVVMLFPVLHRLNDYPWGAIHAQVTQAAEKNGFSVLDVLPAFQAHKQHDLQVYNGDNIHPNQLGHKIAGEALYNFLHQKTPLLPKD